MLYFCQPIAWKIRLTCFLCWSETAKQTTKAAFFKRQMFSKVFLEQFARKLVRQSAVIKTNRQK